MIAKTAAPAAKAVLRQATALRPKRKTASDGLLPSAAHQKQNPSSDHNTGFAVDVTHDPVFGIDGHEVYEHLKSDKRVKYLIFMGRIWSPIKGDIHMMAPISTIIIVIYQSMITVEMTHLLGFLG